MNIVQKLPLSAPCQVSHRRSAHRGFTGTDLLAILAVLAVLATLVLISLVHASRQSRLARCTANLQQIGRAVLSFTEDHSKILPNVIAGSSGDLWWWYKEQVKSYAGLTGASPAQDAVFACPEDRGYSDAKPFHQNPRFDYNSYPYNGVSLPGVPNLAGWLTTAVKEPQRTLLVMEWTAHAPLSWHKSRTGRNNAPFYCDAQSVVGYVDGHVGFTKIYYDGYNAAFTKDPLPGYEYRYSGN